MRVLLGAALLAAMISSSAIGTPVRLTCVSIDPPGDYKIKIEVDLENRRIKYGDLFMDIVRLDDRYVTAINRPDDILYQVGGELLVLDRITGELQRAAIWAGWITGVDPDSKKKLSSPARITTKAFTAQCSKPLL